ncbi:MAG: pitrilysin family protein [Patescibacteria group bacterium]
MKYELNTLSNGVKVLQIPVAGVKSVTALVLFGVGSRYENQPINGLSHFLEHLFFKGSKKRPTAEQISIAVDEVGGEMNAFTSKEYTGYYIKAASQFGELALDVLSDMLLNPLLKEDEIDRERGVIIEEIKMYEDQPMMYVGELFENQLFGDTPLGWDTIGTRQNIKAMQKKQINDYRQNFYTADNMLVVVAGDIAQTTPHLEKYFAQFSGSRHQNYQKWALESRSAYKMHVKPTEQTHLWLGFLGLPANHPDKYVLKVISAILGGGMSSRLFLSVRERQGLAYYVRAASEHYLDSGYLVASAGVATEKVEQAVKAILLEFQKLRDEKVSATELNKVKQYLKGKLLLKIEQTDELAGMLGMQQLLQGEIKTPEEINQLIDAVTLDDISRVAKQIITQQNLCGAFISSEDFSSWLDINLKI